ncbi:hypothetical protein AALO_G00075100 [Alosa alosa]|uniref:Uncharacterized protein n=1 Tax=Alosa alosa TaxID=278164 RepID=A0AAV6GVP2_9TELE|nr:hypothetical protein AALO_G00075100 [Alosa alosa]
MNMDWKQRKMKREASHKANRILSSCTKLSTVDAATQTGSRTNTRRLGREINNTLHSVGSILTALLSS